MSDKKPTLQDTLREVAQYANNAAASLDAGDINTAEDNVAGAIEELRELAHYMRMEF